MEKVRILIAEDHNLVRYGLINLLEEYEWINVAAEAESGEQLIEKYFQIKPDLVISDIKMPHGDGLEAAKKIIQKSPGAKVLFLSMFGADEYIYKAHKIGARGLITKDVLKSDLVNAIRMILDGSTFFCGYNDEKMEQIIKKFKPTQKSAKYQNEYRLSQREIEVLRNITEGLTSDEIAEKMFLSRRTIDTHRRRIMEKLNIHSLPKLLKFAIEYFSENK